MEEDERRKSFDKRKKELHSLYKKYKVGMITQEDLSAEEILLLTKYYPVKFEKTLDGGEIDEAEDL